MLDLVPSVYTPAKIWQNPTDGENEFLLHTDAPITTGRRLKKRIERRIFEHHVNISSISVYIVLMFIVRPGKSKSKGSTHDGAPTMFIIFHYVHFDDIYARIL